MLHTQKLKSQKLHFQTDPSNKKLNWCIQTKKKNILFITIIHQTKTTFRLPKSQSNVPKLMYSDWTKETTLLLHSWNSLIPRNTKEKSSCTAWDLWCRLSIKRRVPLSPLSFSLFRSSQTPLFRSSCCPFPAFYLIFWRVIRIFFAGFISGSKGRYLKIYFLSLLIYFCPLFIFLEGSESRDFPPNLGLL